MTPTSDLCDKHGGAIRVLESDFGSYGGLSSFRGRVSTLSVFEDNTLVRYALAEHGEGRVLVIAGGGSHQCALVGGNLGALAANNGWAGIVVDGCVRDVEELRLSAVGVRALGTCPRRSAKKGLGDRDVAVNVAGVVITPEMWLWADEDGIVVADENLEEI